MLQEAQEVDRSKPSDSLEQGDQPWQHAATHQSGMFEYMGLTDHILPYQVFPELSLNCLAFHLVIPLLLLHEKVSLTTIALLRSVFIIHTNVFISFP